MSVKYGLELKSKLDIILFYIVIVIFILFYFFVIKYLKEFFIVMLFGFLFFFYDLGILNNYIQLKSIRVFNFMIVLMRYMLDVGMLCYMKIYVDKDYFLIYVKMNI